MRGKTCPIGRVGAWLCATVLLPVFCAAPAGAQTYAASTLAGNGIAGYTGDGGFGTEGQFSLPDGMAVDAKGNVFVADVRNHCIRKISPDGTMSTVAGTGTAGFGGDGGPAGKAQLSSPRSVAVDSAGNLFVADTFNNRIRKVTSGGIISSVAGNGTAGFGGDGGPALAAALCFPHSLAIDVSGNVIVADTFNHRIRKITGSGTIITIAGDGTPGFGGDGGSAIGASLSFPRVVATDPAGNTFVSDLLNNRIRKINANGLISTVAGTGRPGFAVGGVPVQEMALSFPTGIVADSSGNMFVSDTRNSSIWKLAADGLATTIAGDGIPGFSGDGGPSLAARLDGPSAISADTGGNVFIADSGNQRVRKLAWVAPGCRFELSIARATAPPEGTDGFVALTTTPECAWTAASTASWIKLTSGTSGTGSGSVSYKVAVNSGEFRAGTVSVAGQVFTIVQAAKESVAPAFSANAVVNAASGTSGGVAPGEYVAVFGTNLGPSVPLFSSSMEKGLGGSRVFFNGIEAYLTYASAGQINALVPYGISGSSSVVMEIEYEAMRSRSVALAGVDAAPGIFTSDSSGSGAAVAFNQDGSVNTPDAPALKGEVVTVWATGQGQTDPPGIDGKQPMPPFPKPSLPVSVTVGEGAVPPSDILFSGMVYAGVLQVNLRIPSEVTVGAQQVVLKVGNASSRPGVTISAADLGRLIVDLAPVPETILVRKIVDRFLLGVGTTDKAGCVSPAFLRAMRAGGLSYFLPFTSWASIARAPNSFTGDPCPGQATIDWLSNTRATLNGHCLLFLFPPSFAVPGFAYGRPYSEQIPLLENFVRATVARFPKIGIWTLNEPIAQNALNWTREQIYDAFVSASRWIRETNPNAKIMLNMIPIPNNWSGLAYDPNQVLDDLLARGLQADIIGIELYADFADAKNIDANGYPKLDWVRSRVDLFRRYNLPILFSEVGVPGGDGRDRVAAQADWAEAFLRQSHSDKAVIGATWYFVRDDPSWAWFGMVNDDYTLRPVGDRILKLAQEWNPATTYVLRGVGYLDLAPGEYDVNTGQQVYRVHISSGSEVRLSTVAP